MENKVRYPHLHLTDWPFQPASPEFSQFMADRSQLASDIATTLKHLSRRSPSTIHLMWAWRGAGKSHSLMYITHLCKSDFRNLLPVFTEFPERVAGFRDLYRSFASQLDYEVTKECFLEVATSSSKADALRELQIASPDLASAMKMLCMGTERQQATIVRWLRGEDTPLRELREVGIGQRIASADDAVKVLVWLMRLMGASYSLSNSVDIGRILWIIDEFQLIAEHHVREAARREINSCLVRIWKSCPTHMSLFLSFTGKPEKTFPDWLSRDLADVIGIEKVIILPPLQDEEALIFVKDLLRHFRSSSQVVPACFPFDEEAVKTLLDKIRKDRKEIKPRSIMQYFNAVLENAEPLIQDGVMKTITAEFALECLKGRILAEA